jgi:hypothetical protein
MSAPIPQAAFQNGAARAPQVNRLYARVANYPNKLVNLRAKIAALRDEAEELGFREEAAHLAAMAVFADCLPKRGPKLVHWSNQEVAQLKVLWLEGIAAAEIGRRLGKTDIAVRTAAKRHGLPVRKRRAVQA